MLVVVLSAGTGSRLTYDGKPQVPSKHLLMLNGETVLGRQVRLLNEVGVDWKVVAGENKRAFRGTVPDDHFLETETDHKNALYELADVCRVTTEEYELLVILGDTVFSKTALYEMLTCGDDGITVFGSGIPNLVAWWNRDGEIFAVKLKKGYIKLGHILFGAMPDLYYELKNIPIQLNLPVIPIKECIDIDYYWDYPQVLLTLHEKEKPFLTPRQEAECQVAQWYGLILERLPDPEGKEHYVSQILTGKITSDDLPFILAMSKEYAEKRGLDDPIARYVSACYWKILKRAPDPEGLETYVKLITSGAMSKDELPQVLMNSQEYRERFQLNLPKIDEYLEDELQASKFLPNGGLQIDVGAERGYWTVLMLQKADAVWAFEPDPRLLGVLFELQKRNRKLTVYPIALSDRDGWETLYIRNIGHTGFVANFHNYKPLWTEKMKIIPLDSIVDSDLTKPVKITAIKIDTEGAEPLVLKGAAKTIERHHPILIVEYHENYDQIKAFMEQFGYKQVYISKRSTTWANGVTVYA